MIDWQAEFHRVPHYERVHLIRGVTLSLLATGIIAALIYVSSNTALSSSYRMAHKSLSYISLGSLLLIIGKKICKDPLSRQEAYALSKYLQANEQYTLPEEGHGQFGIGETVRISTLRFRRNLTYITLLTFSLATLAITGGILAFNQRTGFTHLSAPNLLGLGTALGLWTCGLGIANFTLAKLRVPLTFIPPVAHPEAPLLDDIPNVVRLIQAQSKICMMNNLSLGVQLNNHATGVDTAPELQIIKENKLDCYHQCLTLLRSAEFSSTPLPQEHLENVYDMLFFFCQPEQFYCTREQSSVLLSLMQKHPSFNFMHFLRYSYESEETGVQVNLCEILNVLLISSLKSATLLEVNCIFTVGNRFLKVHRISEHYQTKKNRECDETGVIIHNSYGLPLVVARMCAEFLLPDFDSLSDEDKTWITSFNPYKWDQLLSLNHREIFKRQISVTARSKVSKEKN